MNCNFELCIYQEHERCILDTIQINELGMCEQCEIVSLPQEVLEICKHEKTP